VANNRIQKGRAKVNLIRRFWPDAAIIAVITLVIGSIAQQWSGLDTPDSSFYFTLANFGSEITDRAPIDSYYWTRLGVIAPTYALTQVFGPWIGYFIWRMLLLGIIVAAIYIATRTFKASRQTSTLLAGSLATSTVILSYLGNPYVTAASMAAIAIATCSALFLTKTSAVTGGFAIGWLAMINPYAALMGGSIWLALTIQRNLAAKKPRQIASQFLIAAAATAITFAVFLVVGTQMFPGMNWFSTYIDWNAKLDYSDFASKEPVWLGDPSLLVPLAMLVIIATQWWRLKSPATQAALTIALTTLGVTIAFLPAMAGITLEATIYTSMLWIPLSIAFALSFANHIQPPLWATPIALAILIVAGFQALDFNGYIAVILAVITVALLLTQRRNALIITALIFFLASAQLIQNSRDQIGLYYSSPFGWAYQSNPIKMKLANSLKAQEWLIKNTEPTDQILTYVDGDWLGGDRDLYVAAAMQFWGENRLGVDSTLRPEDLDRIQAYKPTVIALYGPNKSSLEQYTLSLPKELNLSPLTCTAFDWPTSPDGASLCFSTVN
jgi:hypothetical protein